MEPSSAAAGKFTPEQSRRLKQFALGLALAFIGTAAISAGFSFLFGVAGGLIAFGVVAVIWGACLIHGGKE